MEYIRIVRSSTEGQGLPVAKMIVFQRKGIKRNGGEREVGVH